MILVTLVTLVSVGSRGSHLALSFDRLPLTPRGAWMLPQHPQAPPSSPVGVERNCRCSAGCRRRRANFLPMAMTSLLKRLEGGSCPGVELSPLLLREKPVAERWTTAVLKWGVPITIRTFWRYGGECTGRIRAPNVNVNVNDEWYYRSHNDQWAARVSPIQHRHFQPIRTRVWASIHSTTTSCNNPGEAQVVPV